MVSRLPLGMYPSKPYLGHPCQGIY
jgi:hypothetical protein